MEKIICPVFLKSIILIVNMYAMLRCVFVFITNNTLSTKADSAEIEKKSALSNREKLSVFINFIAVIIAGVITMVLAKKISVVYNMFIIMSIPTVTVVIFFLIIRIIKVIEGKEYHNNALTGEESFTIFVLCFFLLIINFAKWNNVLDTIMKLHNSVVLDICCALIIVLVYMVDVFVISSVALILIKDISAIIVKLCYKFKNLYTRIFLRIINSKLDIRNSCFFINFLDFHKNDVNKILKIMKILLFVILIVLDVLLNIFINLIAIFIFMIRMMFICINFILKKAFTCINAMSKYSEKKAMYSCFRFAIITSLILVIAVNRYYPIFIYQEQSTSVLEFVASAILLPLIFEWIQSVSKRKNLKS